MNRAFRGVWIPKEIWLDKDLTAVQKVLLAEIHSLDNEENEGFKKGCYSSNQYFAEFMGISDRQVRNHISYLKKKGYIKQIGFNGRYRVLKSNMRILFKMLRKGKR